MHKSNQHRVIFKMAESNIPNITLVPEDIGCELPGYSPEIIEVSEEHESEQGASHQIPPLILNEDLKRIENLHLNCEPDNTPGTSTLITEIKNSKNIGNYHLLNIVFQPNSIKFFVFHLEDVPQEIESTFDNSSKERFESAYLMSDIFKKCELCHRHTGIVSLSQDNVCEVNKFYVIQCKQNICQFHVPIFLWKIILLTRSLV